MVIYYLMLEAVPNRNNPESRELGGAYINCWVIAKTSEQAIIKAKEYTNKEAWTVIGVYDIYIAQQQMYADDPDALECYDEACKYGISAVFNTWPIDGSETKEAL